MADTHLNGGPVFVLGGTGFIGAEVVRALVRERPSEDVLVLSRSDASEEKARGLGATPVRGDVFQPGPWQREARRAAAVVHVGQPVLKGRVSVRVARRYEAQRLTMDRNLLGALDPAARQRVVYVSGHSYFGETGREIPGDEEMERRPTGMGEYVTAAVDELERYRRAGMDLVTVFPGTVYGNGGWLREFTLEPLRSGKRLMGMRGPSAICSPIHVRDCGRAIAFFLGVSDEQLARHGRSVLLVDDEPVPFRTLTEAAAGALGVPLRTLDLPGWVVRAFVGPVFHSYMTTDAMYSNRRLKELGFELEYPTVGAGMPAVAAELAAVGEGRNVA